MRPMGISFIFGWFCKTQGPPEGERYPPTAVLASNPRRDGISTGADCVSVALNSGHGVARCPTAVENEARV